MVCLGAVPGADLSRRIPERPREEMRLDRYAVIATHHKTGSVWMGSVFRSIARAIGLPFVSLGAAKGQTLAGLSPPAILFSDHSNFSEFSWLIEEPACRLLHVIRDPRDVIISAMHYHRTSSESWLHAPRSMFRGLTYQQTLNQLPDDHARYLFEMKRSSGHVIRDMQNWDYAQANCLECKYEDLVVDSAMVIVGKILDHLGFAPSDLETCRQIFWDNSLFGALDKGPNGHIRSGSGKQWPDVFDERLSRAFLERFPDVLTKLGYERDYSWAGKGGDVRGGSFVTARGKKFRAAHKKVMKSEGEAGAANVSRDGPTGG
jgi:hypothetical protein